jgi:hypothetical protein
MLRKYEGGSDQQIWSIQRKIRLDCDHKLWLSKEKQTTYILRQTVETVPHRDQHMWTQAKEDCHVCSLEGVGSTTTSVETGGTQ